MNNLEVHLGPFREPRGFIKILQWFFAICAFATTVNFYTQFGFTFKCPVSNQTVTATVGVEYPFDLDRQPSVVVPPNCANYSGKLINFIGNAKSDAEYFVTTGVLSFLYAMIAGAMYLLAEKAYQANNKLPLIDFVVTLVLAIFWLSGSAAWAKGVSTISSATSDPTVLYKYNGICEDGLVCTPVNSGGFSKLVVSILFGFINFVLWGGNLWFLYKETTWFESILKNTATPSAAGSSTP